MHTEIIAYPSSTKNFLGFAAYDNEINTRRPAVIVAHAYKGLDDFAKEKALALAEFGYFAFAADLYGNGKTVVSKEEAAAMMTPLFLDRALLQERILAAYETVRKHPLVDDKRIVAIGFCFGGITVIELLRSGADVKGVVSFHALLGDTRDGKKAKTVPIAKNIKGSLLALHGHLDPLVSPQDIQNFQKEFTEAKVDWQMNIYGQAAHAYTNPQANDIKTGFIYNPEATMRSWQAMRNFFDEVLL
jgi:dienelactone hydrolase